MVCSCPRMRGVCVWRGYALAYAYTPRMLCVWACLRVCGWKGVPVLSLCCARGVRGAWSVSCCEALSLTTTTRHGPGRAGPPRPSLAITPTEGFLVKHRPYDDLPFFLAIQRPTQGFPFQPNFLSLCLYIQLWVCARMWVCVQC